MQSELLEAPARPAAELLLSVHRLRRLVRQRLRAEWGSPPLPEAQLELLLLVKGRPGLRVQEAAETLGIAPNTVSTLVRQLGAAGLLERQADARDGRAVHLRLTPAAKTRIARWRDRRQAIVSTAMATLPPADLDAIEAALPALARLVERLETP